MQDEPTPIELVTAVADFLRDDIAPALKGHSAFKLRVAINALDLVARQLTLAGPGEDAERARLSHLLGEEGNLLDLNRKLAEAIGRGTLDLATPGVAEHLWRTTMDKLAVFGDGGGHMAISGSSGYGFPRCSRKTTLPRQRRLYLGPWRYLSNHPN